MRPRSSPDSLFDNRCMPPDLLRSAALIQGLRLENELPVGALVIEPVPLEAGFAGREVRQTFNDLLAARGFVSAFDRPTWAMQLAPRRRLAFVATPATEVDPLVPAAMEATASLGRLVDSLALTHGGAPEIFAAVNEVSSDGGQSWRTLALIVGSGTYPGSVLERLLPEGEHLAAADPREVWVRAESSPLFALWLGLYRGVSAEVQWDVRVLRACGLLEAIGGERYRRVTAIVDESGGPLFGYDGKPASTESLRGLLYALVSDSCKEVLSSPRVLLAHETRSLWEEVGI